MKKLILASGSPRRRELLEMAGYDFDILPSNKEEKEDAASPMDYVCNLSRMKAKDIAYRMPVRERHIVIGADTIVVYRGEILGKPKDEAEALHMLTMLSGKMHSVFTGVSVIDTESHDLQTFFEETRVKMFENTKADLESYIATGDPMDKAGAYGIQTGGALLIEGIEGDYYNVVGLPIARLSRLLRKIL